MCMVMIANLQYGWTLFVNPIEQKYHWGVPAIQVAFSVFIATETWLVPVEGWFVDRFGPRIVVAFGGIVVAVAWALNSFADSLVLLYVAAAIGGARCWCRLRHLHRQCTQMVSRSARACGGLDSCGFWRGCGSNGHTHPQRDNRLRL